MYWRQFQNWSMDVRQQWEELWPGYYVLALTWREHQGKVGGGEGQIEQVEFSVWSMWCLVAGLVMTVIRNIIDRVKSLQVRVYCDGYLGQWSTAGKTGNKERTLVPVVWPCDFSDWRKVEGASDSSRKKQKQKNHYQPSPPPTEIHWKTTEGQSSYLTHKTIISFMKYWPQFTGEKT